MKPLFGAEGRGIIRPRSLAEAGSAIREIASQQGVFYLQEYIDHGGSDLRLFVMCKEMLASMKGMATPGQWLTNISQGSSAESFAPGEDIEELALRAARAVGAEIAGVDILKGPDGAPRILEVNAIPGWRAISKVCGKDMALAVLDYVTERAADLDSETIGALQS